MSEGSRCSDVFVSNVEDSYRKLGMLAFFVTNITLAASIYWWYQNRENDRLAVRPLSSVVFMAIYVFGETLSEPLKWYSLDEEGFLNSCEFTQIVRNTRNQTFFIAIVIRLLAYHWRFRQFKAVENAIEKPSSEETEVSFHRRLQRIFFYSSSKLTWMFAMGTFIILIPITIFTISNFCSETGNGVECSQSSVVAGSIITFATALVLILMRYETSKFPDPFGIIQEAMVNVSLEVLGLAALWISLKSPSGIILFSKKTPSFTPGLFTFIATFANLIYSFPYQIYLSRKYNQMSLGEVLYMPGGRKMFSQHLKEDFCQETLEFYLEASKWTQEYYAVPEEKRNKAAEEICSKWIKDDAPDALNISNRRRAHVANIMESNEDYPRDLFSEVKADVFMLMATDDFMRFRHGPLFRVLIGLAKPEENWNGLWSHGPRLVGVTEL